MGELWSFIGQKKNREILAWIGGGVTMIIAGLWTVVVYYSTPYKTTASKPAVEATDNSIAAGRDAIGNTIKRGDSQAPEQKP
jgi:hypothetical protein